MITADSTQIVTFRLGGDLFAADIFAVERVLRYQLPSPVPNTPAWIEGVLEYRGRVVPVINLRRRFELPAGEVTGETRAIVLNIAGDFVAAIVDAVLDVSVLEPARLAPPPPLFRGLSGQFLKGIVRRADRLVMLLDVERLLSSSERIALQAAAPADDAALPSANPGDSAG